MSDWKDKLVKGVQALPPRLCVFGGHGIGKSTLASQFPSPIFISTEDGLASLDVVSFPRIETLAEVGTHIRTLIKEAHTFKTIVIDSVDWLVEPLITGDIESKHDAKDLAYGKGQMMVAEVLRELFNGLDILRKKRDMNVVLIAHAAVVRYEDPRSEPYDRYQPKIPNRCNALLQEWVDVLAFAGFKVMIKKDDAGFGNKTTRGVTTGERLLHLVENPAYVAKNRYSCPDTIPMSYEQLVKHIPVKS